MGSIFYNFFFRQYRRALFPGRIPVSQADHGLDGKIPFTPEWIAVYLDFVPLWIRSLGFLLREYGEKAEPGVREFLVSMNSLYRFAAEVYEKNLSTTRRPFYIRRLRFILIHAFDPHLMCIPSLHVMVVIHTYTQFTRIIGSMGGGQTYAAQIAEIRRGALDIAEAILYVKQHSVNCVPAAMYAMTRFDRELFPPAAAEDFISRLFAGPAEDEAPGKAAVLYRIDPAAGAAIKDYIRTLYRRFLEEGTGAEPWDTPLVNFLKGLPQRHGGGHDRRPARSAASG
jgi:hypothetical protein